MGPFCSPHLHLNASRTGVGRLFAEVAWVMCGLSVDAHVAAQAAEV